jgi:hypothetical protein
MTNPKPTEGWAIVAKDGLLRSSLCCDTEEEARWYLEHVAETIIPVTIIPTADLVREAARVLGLAWNKTVDGLPKKPGLKSYEYVECLILKKDGDIEIGMWNCEHECWDDEECDDYRYDPTEPVAWLPIAALRALAGQGGE